VFDTYWRFAAEGQEIYVDQVATVHIGDTFRVASRQGNQRSRGWRRRHSQWSEDERCYPGGKERLAEIQPGLPAGVRIVPFYDRSTLINASREHFLDATSGVENRGDERVDAPMREGLGSAREDCLQHWLLMRANKSFLQPLRSQLHNRGDLALLTQLAAESVQRPQPCVAGHGFHPALTGDGRRRTGDQCGRSGARRRGGDALQLVPA